VTDFEDFEHDGVRVRFYNRREWRQRDDDLDDDDDERGR